MTGYLALAFWIGDAWIGVGFFMTALAIRCDPTNPLWVDLRSRGILVKVLRAFCLALIWPRAWAPRRGRHR